MIGMVYHTVTAFGMAFSNKSSEIQSKHGFRIDEVGYPIMGMIAKYYS